jgi:hypothetical protein
MVGFLKKVFSSSEGKGAKQQAGQRAASPLDKESLDIARLTEVFRYFPLGEKIRYYPEFQQDCALDTIVLGYGVNGQFVYSPLDISCQQEGERDVLRITVDGAKQTVREVDSFCLLIPFNREDENKRDYTRRAELGPRGPFRRHNVISLLACTTGGVKSTLDTVVRKIIPLDSGIYAGHEVVLLDALPSTLSLTDQRQHYRLQTALPATLAMKDGGVHDCTMMDFSEDSVHLQFAEPNADLAALTEFRRLTLDITIGSDNPGKKFSLDGVMYRKTDTTLVMKLQGIYKNGQLEQLGLVDILDIKASLLQHPATQQAQEEQHGA